MILHPKNIAVALLLSLSLLMTGCSQKKSVESDAIPSAAEQYNKAKLELEEKEYDVAINSFQDVVNRYPFGVYAQQSLLDIAYVYYQKGEPNLALAKLDELMALNPNHKDMDYILFLQGLVNDNFHSNGFFSGLSSDAERKSSLDTTPTKAAFESYKSLITQFPKSRYVSDARRRMINLRSALANHELKIAQFYYDRAAYVATINRCKYILTNFSGDKRIADTLLLLANSYKNVGNESGYDDTLKVLALNYPEIAKEFNLESL